MVNEIFDQEFTFESADDAKQFFLGLQNNLRNLNFIPFNTERYHHLISEIRDKLEKIQVKAGV